LISVFYPILLISEPLFLYEGVATRDEQTLMLTSSSWKLFYHLSSFIFIVFNKK
jgi:hypothetical protein